MAIQELSKAESDLVSGGNLTLNLDLNGVLGGVGGLLVGVLGTVGGLLTGLLGTVGSLLNGLLGGLLNGQNR